MRRSLKWLLAVALVSAACTSLMTASAADEPASAEDPSTAPCELEPHEQAFVDLMDQCVLVGRFTVDGQEEESTSTDRYTINKVTKVDGEDWLVHARIVYGQFDAVVPVPVKMQWAGETPVLSVTDLTIPLLGDKFSARLLFHDGRYAGTWGHGPVGGHMWGLVEKAEEDAGQVPE